MAVEYINILKREFGDSILESHDFQGDDTVVVRCDSWINVCSFLKYKHGFDMLMDLCGADFPEDENRFEVIVHLRQSIGGKRLRVKTRCQGGDPSLHSLCKVFPCANWFEREAFDFFGIKFEGHPNLKRILCHNDFEGHALRKDFSKDRRFDLSKPDTLMDEITNFGESWGHGT